MLSCVTTVEPERSREGLHCEEHTFNGRAESGGQPLLGRYTHRVFEAAITCQLQCTKLRLLQHLHLDLVQGAAGVNQIVEEHTWGADCEGVGLKGEDVIQSRQLGNACRGPEKAVSKSVPVPMGHS